jgi:hypothetical protein
MCPYVKTYYVNYVVKKNMLLMRTFNRTNPSKKA